MPSLSRLMIQLNVKLDAYICSMALVMFVTLEAFRKFTELEPHLSPEFMKIMEKRLSAIEYRSSCLQNFMNQVFV